MVGSGGRHGVGVATWNGTRTTVLHTLQKVHGYLGLGRFYFSIPDFGNRFMYKIKKTINEQ